MRRPARAMEQAATINARQVALVFALSFATFCAFAQIVRSFLN